MYEYNATMVKVVDGDTFDFDIDLGFSISHRIRVRLYGVDTPEIYRPRNKIEYAHGIEAKEFVEEYFLGKTGVLNTVRDKKGKYGRYLANFIVKMDSGKNDLAENIVSAGLAKKDNY